MAIDIDHYQDSGPVVAGRGTTTTLITNIGWKAANTSEDVSYVLDPLVRPREAVETFTVRIPGIASTCGISTSDVQYNTTQSRIHQFVTSYDYYTFFKLSGTYAAASRVRISISGDVNGSAPSGYDGALGGARLYFRLTDTYQTPNNVDDGELRFFAGGTEILFPKISTTGPTSNLNYVKFLTANTTYYTQFVHTRLYVQPGQTFGNIGEIKFSCYVDEYEDGDV